MINALFQSVLLIYVLFYNAFIKVFVAPKMTDQSDSLHGFAGWNSRVFIFFFRQEKYLSIKVQLYKNLFFLRKSYFDFLKIIL